MTHLGFILPAYALAVAIPVGFAVATWLRLRKAERILDAIDPRRADQARAR